MTVPSSAGRVASSARTALRRVRAAASAEGAGQTGLGRLIEIHGMSGAGDAIVAVALAGTLFFGVPVGQARGRVALYLLLTMAPFAVLAPVVGPLLDRVRRGRRLAIAATLVARGVLALSMARALAGSDPLALYPEAFALLICSKGYGVARSAVVPRLLPHGFALVRANSRISLAGLLLAAAAAPIGGGVAALFGPDWTLRLAAVAYFLAAGLTFGLPPHVDADDWDVAPPPRRRGPFLPFAALGRRVPIALVSAAALRGANGFLTVFVAFLLRNEHGVGPLSSNVALGAVVGAAALGGVAGTALGGRWHTRRPVGLAVVSVAVTAAVCLLGALFYALIPLLLVGLTTGMGQALSKLALDSQIQRDVGDAVRSSAFSLSESTLQVAWVVGGVGGILVPLIAPLGLGVVTFGVVLALAWCLHAVHEAGSSGALSGAG